MHSALDPEPDELEQARAEKEEEPLILNARGKKFSLSRDPGWQFHDHLAELRTVDAMKLLLNGQYQDFVALNLSREQVLVFFNRAVELVFGGNMGESKASGSSSARTSARSGRPSTGST